MPCVILNAISFIMVYVLKYIEYNKVYIIARGRPLLFFMSLQDIYTSGIG